jgi:hypothetical protein
MFSDNNYYLDNYSGDFIFRRASFAETMHLASGGNVGIGAMSPTNPLQVLSGTANTAGDSITFATAQVTGPNWTMNGGSSNGTFLVSTNDAVATNVGGSIGFAGRYSGTAQATFAAIKGASEDGAYAGYLAFGTRVAGTQISEKMRITGAGNVGIGTATPISVASTNLHVYGASTASVEINNGTTGAGTSQGAAVSEWGNDFYIDNRPATGNIIFNVNAGTERMRIDSSGNVSVGISTTPAGSGLTINNASTPTLTFQVAGTRAEYMYDNGSTFFVLANAGMGSKLNHGDTIWTSSSDRRLKTDITPLPASYGLNAIVGLDPVTFHWRNPDASKKLQLGLIAQDVQKIIPEIVSRGEPTAYAPDGELGIQYPALVVPLIKAVKELKADNDNLRAANDNEAAQIKTLTARLDALEAARR